MPQTETRFAYLVGCIGSRVRLLGIGAFNGNGTIVDESSRLLSAENDGYDRVTWLESCPEHVPPARA